MTRRAPTARPPDVARAPRAGARAGAGWERLGAPLVALADAVLGGEPPIDRRAGWRFAGVALGVWLLLALRRPDRLLRPQFWAEDGALYFRDQLLLGFGPALAKLYTGFPYLLHRLVAWAATPFGIAQAPLVYNLAALTVAALSLALFSLPHFRHLVHNDWLRALFCLTLAAAPDAREITIIMTNMHWYLGIAALFLALMRLPRSRGGLALVLALYGLCLFSSPVAIISVPFWLLRFLRAVLVRRHPAQLLAPLGVVGAVVALDAVSTRNLGANVAMRFDPTAFTNIVAGRVVTQALLGEVWTRKLGQLFGFPFFYALTALAIVALVALSLAVRGRNLPVLLICAYALVASLAITLLGRSEWNDFAQQVGTLFLLQAGRWTGDGGRYFFIGLSMVYLALFATLDRLRPVVARGAVGGALAVVLVVALAPSFRIPPLPNLAWPEQAARLEAKRATNDRGPLLIPISPYGWTIPFDPGVAFPTAAVPAQVAVGELNDGRVAAETFRSACAPLYQVELRLATYAHVLRQPVVLQLRDDTTGQTLAERAIDGPDVADNAWATLPVGPLPDAQGKIYRVVVSSPGSRPDNTVTVWRSATDVYPDGAAFLDGTPLPGDLVFRYWCGG